MCHVLKYKTGGKIIAPRSFVKGGSVKAKHKNIPVHALKPKDPDQVLARLMPGEIVIPVKHTKKVKAFLKTAKIKLPGL